MAAVVIITNMDPKPGSVYNEERIQAIVPDVYVIKSGDDYKVFLMTTVCRDSGSAIFTVRSWAGWARG